MASEEGNSDDRQGETHEPRECMACRGTGHVISNLGGAPSEVACPWCRGTGTRIPGIDAQAHWAEQGSDDGAEGTQRPAQAPGASPSGEDPAA